MSYGVSLDRIGKKKVGTKRPTMIVVLMPQIFAMKSGDCATVGTQAVSEVAIGGEKMLCSKPTARVKLVKIAPTPIHSRNSFPMPLFARRIQVSLVQFLTAAASLKRPLRSVPEPPPMLDNLQQQRMQSDIVSV